MTRSSQIEIPEIGNRGTVRKVYVVLVGGMWANTDTDIALSLR